MLNIPSPTRYKVRLALDRLGQQPASDTTLDRLDDNVLPNHAKHPVC